MLAEVLCVAMIVYHEARGEPLLGQVAVANTLQRRVERSEWADTFCEVAKEPAQYQITWMEPREPHAWVWAVNISWLAVTGKLDDQVNGATHFYAHDEGRPWWAGSPRMTLVTVINGHTFMREKRR